MDHKTDIFVTKEESKMQMQENEIVLYQPNDAIHLEVRIEEDTVWLNRNQMSILFGRDVKTIGKHVNNALREELQGMATVAKFAIVQNEGGRADLHTRHHTTTCPRPAAPQCAIPPHRHR